MLFDVIVKLNEMLKKIFPIASTLMRAEDVGVLGTLIVALPLFAVVDTSVNGLLLPPSTDRHTHIATIDGALEVFATFR